MFGTGNLRFLSLNQACTWRHTPHLNERKSGVSTLIFQYFIIIVNSLMTYSHEHLGCHRLPLEPDFRLK